MMIFARRSLVAHSRFAPRHRAYGPLKPLECISTQSRGMAEYNIPVCLRLSAILFWPYCPDAKTYDQDDTKHDDPTDEA